MTKRIAVFHFSPLEMFPPAMNFLDCLISETSKNVQIRVYTTSANKGTHLYNPGDRKITIRRLAKFTYGLGPFHRAIQYGKFYSRSLLDCLLRKPGDIVYYETISSFVPLLMKKWFHRKVNLFIHYHEYMSEAEYQVMFQNRVFHQMEKSIYSRARWISHTNARRMKLFLHDIGNPPLSNTHIFPNYPPNSWKNSEKGSTNDLPIRLVYIGSMGSIDLHYTREIMTWVKSMKGKVLLDVYSFNIEQRIQDFVKELNCKDIALKGPVSYQDLPKVLAGYHVGLILYKTTSENVIYSEPNKLFEYLVCGLDVWYPREMLGSKEYNSTEYWPKVLGLDFSNLEQYDLEDLIRRKEGNKRAIEFTCEAASRELVQLLQP